MDLKKKIEQARKMGYSDDQIQQVLSAHDQAQKTLQPVTPSPGTPDSGMSIENATQPDQPITPSPQPEPSIVSRVGQGVVDVAKGVFAAPARFGKALGGAAGMVATQGDFEKTQEDLRNTADKYTQKAIELSKVGNKEESDRMFQLAQETIKKGQDMANERLGQADEGIQDTIKGGVGTAAFFVPGGQATLPARVASGAATGAMAGYGASKEGEELSSTVGGATIGGAVPIVTNVLGKIIGAVKPAQEENILKRAGDYLREDATKIRVKPSVWGAQQEKAIQETLNDLDIKGTPQQKYELLSPRMEKLGQEITTELRASPSEIPVKNVMTKFHDALKSAIRTSDLTTTTAQKEIKGYLTDLYEAAGHDIKGTITNENFFALKKLVNEDYQGVAKKLLNNNPLTDREKVIQVARQVFDRVVSEANPKVKEMTLMQSHLYDAAHSLSVARDSIPTTRIAGTTVPTPILKGGEDKLGEILQNAGKSAQTVQQKGMDIANAVGSVVPPANMVIASGVGATGEQNSPQSQQDQQTIPQGEQSDGDQNNQDQNGDHNKTISQPQNTVTGYTVEQLGQAYSRALMAGDKAAATQLKQLYDVESGYQKNLTTGTGKPKTEAQVAREDMVYLIDEATKLMDTTNPITGMIRPGLEETKAVFGMGDQATLDLNNVISQMKASLAKARAGTSFTPNEEKLLNKYTPNVGDSEQQLRTKINGLRGVFDRHKDDLIISDTAASGIGINNTAQ